jgi:biopolymer transport protein ExbB
VPAVHFRQQDGASRWSCQPGPLLRFLQWSNGNARQVVPIGIMVLALTATCQNPASAAESPAAPQVRLGQLFQDGGTIGYIIVGLSVAMVSLVFEHLFTIRRAALMPGDLAEDVHSLLMQGQLTAAEKRCRERPSFLGYVLAAGLAEIQLGYQAVEKAMEDAATQQSARLYRKIEYLSLISTVAPLLGLMGTVWGMILAFMEFEAKANPTVSELAPGVYRALVTTLFGLIVAIPAISAFAIFRNRIDELVAQTVLLAEHTFGDFKRATVRRKADRSPVDRSQSGEAAG